jgi:D-alanyl-lipoteichoic acid acyltransferase DltB (MBOAT superfamily)
MLFNSHVFIFLFLPVALAGVFLLARVSRKLAAAWLAGMSLFFYAWWNPPYVVLLLASIVFNYHLGMAIARAAARGDARRNRRLTVFAVAADLAVLGYYKYTNFFLSNVSLLLGDAPVHAEIVLPLGISFFTFTQIAFLVDAHRGQVKAEYNFVDYCLFVTYFPHLIAGPIFHHAEMMPQFADPSTWRLRAENLAVGTTIFVIGLFKKVILADGIAPYVGPLFDLPKNGIEPTFWEAWFGVTAYSLQLYFDFSGYSDMAIGLARMFGVRLPLNFHSPYKAASISELWQRWHMTLSRFLREYVFVPLGGHRKSALRRYWSLFATMVLCGVWHGAGWTYVVFGVLHGFYLCANQGWRSLRRRWNGGRKPRATRWGRVAGCLVTFAAWLVGLAFFRSETVADAMALVGGMAGLNGFALPDHWLAKWGALGQWLAACGVEFTDARGLVRGGLVNWLVILLAIVWFAPNTQQIMARWSPALLVPRDMQPARWQWRPSFGAAAVLAGMALAVLFNLHRHSEFLYFQF